MAAPKRKAARAGYIQTRIGTVHVPDLTVSDHEGELLVGFLHHRFRKTEDAQPESLPQPNPDWRAPQKFERRR